MVARPSSSTSATASVRQTKPNARRKKTTATMTSTTQQQNSSRTTTILNAKTNFHHASVGGESDTENDGDDENSTIGLNT